MLEGLKGVLNDFDLSTVMEVDALTPAGLATRGLEQNLSWHLIFLQNPVAVVCSPASTATSSNPSRGSSSGQAVASQGLALLLISGSPRITRESTRKNSLLHHRFPSPEKVQYYLISPSEKAWLNFWFDFHIAWLRREPQGRLEEGDTCRDFIIEMIRLMDGLDLPMEKSWWDVQILNVN